MVSSCLQHERTLTGAQVLMLLPVQQSYENSLAASMSSLAADTCSLLARLHSPLEAIMLCAWPVRPRQTARKAGSQHSGNDALTEQRVRPSVMSSIATIGVACEALVDRSACNKVSTRSID